MAFSSSHACLLLGCISASLAASSKISGLLADPTHRTGCGYQSAEHLCLSVDSWWADVNYFLSMIPFLAAAEAGIFGISPDDIIFLPPPKDQNKFCSDVSSCHASFPEAMKKWNEFYQHVKSPASSFDDLLKYVWDAHFSSLKVAGKSFQSSLAPRLMFILHKRRVYPLPSLPSESELQPAKQLPVLTQPLDLIPTTAKEK